MSCIDPKHLNIDVLDVNRIIQIPIRTPYHLTLKPGFSCPSGSLSLHDYVANNNNRMGGITTDETASIHCEINNNLYMDYNVYSDAFVAQRPNLIYIDILNTQDITISNSLCSISKGFYNSIYLKNSVLSASVINSTIFTTDTVGAIDRSIIKAKESVLWMNSQRAGILESTLQCQNFLMYNGNTIDIVESTINADNISLLSKVVAEQSNFNMNNIALVSNSRFEQCTLSLNAESGVKLQLNTSDSSGNGIKSLFNYISDIRSNPAYKERSCPNDEYIFTPEGQIEGCSGTIAVVDSPMVSGIGDAQGQYAIDLSEIGLQVGEVPRDSQYDSDIANATDHMIGVQQMISWISGQPFSFMKDPIIVGNVFRKCQFTDIIINSANALILDDCSITSSLSGTSIINADQILSRRFSVAKQATQGAGIDLNYAPTIINDFSYDEDSGKYTFVKTNANIGASGVPLKLSTDITTRDWIGEVSIQPGHSIRCERFFSQYCNIADGASLILENNKNIYLGNLGIHKMYGVIAMPNDGILIASRNDIPLQHQPDLKGGTISGTSMTIRTQSTGVLQDARIFCQSLSLENDMVQEIASIGTVAGFDTIGITGGGNYIINNLGGPGYPATGNITLEHADLKLNYIERDGTIFYAPWASLALQCDDSKIAFPSNSILEDTKMTRSTLYSGTLVTPIINYGIQNISGHIIAPNIADHIFYYGVNSTLAFANFPAVNPSGSDRSIIEFKHNANNDDPYLYIPTINSCTIPSGNSVNSNGKLKIFNTRESYVEINSYAQSKFLSTDIDTTDIATMIADEILIGGGKTIISYSDINNIYDIYALDDNLNITEPTGLAWKTSLIELNSININDHKKSLIISEPTCRVRDFVAKKTKIELAEGEHKFINLSIEAGSVLDGKNQNPSDIAFLFNAIEHSTVQNLNLNLYAYMTTDLANFRNCNLNLKPLTLTQYPNIPNDFIDQLEAMKAPTTRGFFSSSDNSPPLAYYHIKKTELQNCSITGLGWYDLGEEYGEQRNILYIDDCNLISVELQSPLGYDFKNNHFSKDSFVNNNRDIFPTGSSVSLSECYWKNINWNINQVSMYFNKTIDNSELIKPSIVAYSGSSVNFYDDKSIAYVSGDSTSQIRFSAGSENLATIDGDLDTWLDYSTNATSGQIDTRGSLRMRYSTNNGTIQTATANTTESINNNLINVSVSGYFNKTENNPSGSIISTTGEIVLYNCTNNGTINCETLKIFNSTNNGTINCNNLTWRNSTNTTSNVIYQNAISIDDSLTYPS